MRFYPLLPYCFCWFSFLRYLALPAYLAKGKEKAIARMADSRLMLFEGKQERVDALHGFDLHEFEVMVFRLEEIPEALLVFVFGV